MEQLKSECSSINLERLNINVVKLRERDFTRQRSNRKGLLANQISRSRLRPPFPRASAYRFHVATGGKRHVCSLESRNFVAPPQGKETKEGNEQDTSLSPAYGTSVASQDCVFSAVKIFRNPQRNLELSPWRKQGEGKGG